MPFDREIHLGYVGVDAVWNFARRIGADIIEDSGRTTKILTESDIRSKNWQAQLDPAICDKYQPILRQAYCNAILAQGWKIIPNHKVKNIRGSHSKDHIYVESPWGLREASYWHLDIYFDPNEVGDSPEEITLGVDLSGRYFPKMLDMHDTFGTMGSVIQLNQKLMDQIAICKRELIKVIPELHDAEVYIKEIFY